MKLETPPGTRDFLPGEMLKRQELIDRIRDGFESYGFSPMETPAFEYAELFEGKYGEEEKLIYKFEDLGKRRLALRYDLTVPLVRVVGMNQLPLPFKRYCISRVWRFDRPQKGRYREFWQCDVDTVGTDSMEADAEIIACAVDALENIGLSKFRFKLNNRKLLDGVMRYLGIPRENELDAFRALDKLEKQGKKKVLEELKERGVPNGEALLDFLKLDKLDDIEKKIGKNEGIDELREIFTVLKKIGKEKKVVLDLAMVRGLDYYTGPIFEVEEGDYGSIAGGGRYDKIIGKLSGKEAPAVGISLGIERIIEVLKERKQLPMSARKKVYVLCADDESKDEAGKITQELRSAGGLTVNRDLMSRNFSGQLKDASKKGCDKVVIVGQKDLSRGNVTIKDMSSGEQKTVTLQKINEALND
jgi:histidyl-tRNA synthetase